jgi:hypothetical protein
LRATKGMTLLSAFCGFILILNARTIVTLWVGAGFSSCYPVVLILGIGYIIGLAQEPCRLLVFAQARHHRALAWWTCVEGVTMVMLSIGLAKAYGLAGVALGAMAPFVLIKLSVHPWYALRSVGLGLQEYLIRGLLRPALTVALFLGLCLYKGGESEPRAVGLVWNLAWQTALFFCLSYLVALSGAERRLVKTWVQKRARAFRWQQLEFWVAPKEHSPAGTSYRAPRATPLDAPPGITMSGDSGSPS